jgi:hypothetical protein
VLFYDDSKETAGKPVIRLRGARETIEVSPVSLRAAQLRTAMARVAG